MSDHMHFESALFENLGVLGFKLVETELGRATGLDNHTSAWADQDNDGILDVITSNGFLRPNHFLSVNPDGSYKDRTFSSGVNATGVHLGDRGVKWLDLNGDGWLDIQTVGQQSFDHTILSSGPGLFNHNPQRPPHEAPKYSYSFMAGDIDNDGDIDLIFLTYNLGLVVALNRGNATFNLTLPEASKHRINAPANFDMGDYDNDGDLDIVLADRAGQLFTLENRGHGEFQSSLSIKGHEQLEFEFSNVLMEDFDNDGWLDIFLINRSASAVDAPLESVVARNINGSHFVIPNLVNKKFANHQASRLADRSQAATADFDLDGLLDLVIGEDGG